MCGKLPHVETLSNQDNYSLFVCVTENVNISDFNMWKMCITNLHIETFSVTHTNNDWKLAWAQTLEIKYFQSDFLDFYYVWKFAVHTRIESTFQGTFTIKIFIVMRSVWCFLAIHN